MSDGVSIKKLAETVGSSADKLIVQLNEALSQHGETLIDNADQILTPKQKQYLLDYLQQQKTTTKATDAGKASLTLRRQRVKQDVKVTTNTGSKTVSVEVRKKRVIRKEPTAAAPVEEMTPEVAAPAVVEPTEAPEILSTGVIETPAKTDEEGSPVSKTILPATEADKRKRKGKGGGEDEDELRGKRRLSRAELKERAVMGDDEGEEGKVFRRRRKRKGEHKNSAQHAFEKPVIPVIREVMIPETISVGDLAQKMAVKASEVIKVMMNMGAMVTINQLIEQSIAAIDVEEMGHKPVLMKENA